MSGGDSAIRSDFSLRNASIRTVFSEIVGECDYAREMHWCQIQNNQGIRYEYIQWREKTFPAGLALNV